MTHVGALVQTEIPSFHARRRAFEILRNRAYGTECLGLDVVSRIDQILGRRGFEQERSAAAAMLGDAALYHNTCGRHDRAANCYAAKLYLH